MASFWCGTVRQLLQTPRDTILGTLATTQIRYFRLNERQQIRAWDVSIALLCATFSDWAEAMGWTILLEYPLLRLGHRPDAIILTRHAIFVLEFKIGADGHTLGARRQVEDYAIDLYDFHAGSRSNPIIPILIADEAPTVLQQSPLLLGHGVAAPIDARADNLGDLLRDLDQQAATQAEPMSADGWLKCRYEPVPTVIEAACLLYARHGVDEIRTARSDVTNLQETTEAIIREIMAAQRADERVILFVTGIPGAGKTLCGLNAVFGVEQAVAGTYLTGNPTLVHVLREALTREAAQSNGRQADARRRFAAIIQALPKFRDEYVAHPHHVPPERLIVIDEAQRCWSQSWAVQKTRDKAHPLTRSEPAHLLDAMARHEGFCAIVCLVGSGQEIHAGEGGLAEWGKALREARESGIAWRVRAAPSLTKITDPRQQIGLLPSLATIPTLHLDVPVRQIRNTAATDWVDRMLEGEAATAAQIARTAGPLPFFLTRSQDDMRSWLRAESRGLRRCGLLASSGAARLRAEGLGAELPHMDEKAVAHWFLDRFPDDIRASDALELIATEFCCQGLELDYVGLCWDADMIRSGSERPWQVRKFHGNRWLSVHKAEAIANQINTYRVLLTRARYETVLYVPRGSDLDPTRDPVVYDRIAAFLQMCGVQALPACQADAHSVGDANLL